MSFFSSPPINLARRSQGTLTVRVGADSATIVECPAPGVGVASVLIGAAVIGAAAYYLGKANEAKEEREISNILRPRLPVSTRPVVLLDPETRASLERLPPVEWQREAKAARHWAPGSPPPTRAELLFYRDRMLRGLQET